MSHFQLSFRSSIGRKLWVGISGLALMGFVVAHLSGNLLIFGGQNAFNTYAKSLENLGPLLWALRIGLLVFFLIHVKFAIEVSLENKRARPVAYQKRNFQKASLPSRTMLLTGLTLLVFILFHLAHYTFHVVFNTGPHLDALGRKDVYTMAVLGFQNTPLTVLYIAAMGVLAFHLSHAVPSVLQTFGLDRTQIGKCADRAGLAFALLIFAGYVSIPVSVWLGFVQLPGAN